MTRLYFSNDARGFNTFIRNNSSLKACVKFDVASTEKTYTLPTENKKYMVLFSYTGQGEIWVAINKTATLPTSTLTTTDSELHPIAYELFAGDVIHAISDSADISIGITIYECI